MLSGLNIHVVLSAGPPSQAEFRDKGDEVFLVLSLNTSNESTMTSQITAILTEEFEALWETKLRKHNDKVIQMLKCDLDLEVRSLNSQNSIVSSSSFNQLQTRRPRLSASFTTLSYPVFRTYIRQYSHASSGPSDALSMSPVPIRIPTPLHIHIQIPLPPYIRPPYLRS
ncbi:hypothetical protein EV424DRAFT_1536143 [Suillus variegatus]|nr:hypothetical protein EV424DRAFT_1536143 [Suillus variegatus]